MGKFFKGVRLFGTPCTNRVIQGLLRCYTRSPCMVTIIEKGREYICQQILQVNQKE